MKQTVKPVRERIIYGQWAGNERGVLEDETRCIKAIYEWYSHQCSRKRGFGKDGLYCKQHAKDNL